MDESCYGRTPDPEIPLTANGHEQARGSGRRIRALMEADGPSACLFVYVSPYMRSKQTAVDIVAQLPGGALLGVREEPQLREQDFGNLQDLNAKAKEKALRQAYGRFFFRYSNGESGSDVYDRLTSFEDHMARARVPASAPEHRRLNCVQLTRRKPRPLVFGGGVGTLQVRDIDGGRFPAATTLLVVTHGLALRLFLSRWLHWTVAEYELAFNPPNCEPVVLERRPVPEDQVCVGAGDDRVRAARAARVARPRLGGGGGEGG